MDNKGHEPTGATDFNSAIRVLHDELKSLVLTCAPEFPNEAAGGLEFLQDVADLQAIIAAYYRELLVTFFDLAGSGRESVVAILHSASGFMSLWQERRTLSIRETRAENEIDVAIRNIVRPLLEEMRLLGEDELRTATRDDDIPKMLYYLSTVEQALCWYSGRYLARLTGELEKIGN
jgi:hypothetical protein